MDKVCIIEGIMGSGKSSAVINEILRNPEEKIMIIVNYISEGERYKSFLVSKNFVLAGNVIKQSKSADLIRALKNQQSIICTKSLFKMNAQIIKEFVSDYILIIDEAMNDLIELYQPPKLSICNKKDEIRNNKRINNCNNYLNREETIKYSITQNDIQIMLREKIVYIDMENKLIWRDELNEPTIYDVIKNDFINNSIYQFEENYIKVFPMAVFNSFKRIFILTYMWDCQIMKYYFEMHGIKNFHIEFPCIINNEYRLTQLEHDYLKYADIIKKNALSHIYLEDKGNKWTYKDKNNNEIFLSYNFYLNHASESEYENVIKTLKNNINNCIKNNNVFKDKSTRNEMWTIYKDAIEIIVDKKYGKTSVRGLKKSNFVEFNKIATNDYSDKNTLFYLIDRYKNPYIKKFIEIKTKSIFKENEFALNELIQWVWRSAIRVNKDIYLYIASKRMNDLFKNWLNTKEKTSSGITYLFREQE